jgi:dTDP-4-amino-4,6-dideoxygalactose transaminase
MGDGVAHAVRFWNPPREYAALKTEIMSTIDGVLSDGDLVMRHQMEDFERNFAAFVGRQEAVSMSNCTDALRLTLEALGVGPGDEVVTVAHTFVATMAAIHHVGATPILVDVGQDHNLDVDLLEAALTPRTKAIIPVHLNGRLCEMDRLMALAKSREIPVLEDAAQSLGASFQGVPGGGWGIAGAFSFYPAKMLGALGDGGAIVTDDAGLAQRLRELRDHGRVSKTELSGWGWNCRLDNLQAAILDLKLKHLPGWIERRRRIAGIYNESLTGIAGLRLPPPPDGGAHFDVYQNYVIESNQRDRLVEHLADSGVETLVSWPVPMHHQPLGLNHFSLPRTEALAGRVVSLPMHNVLEEEEAIRVADAVRAFAG